jgi:superfamily II DNA or RNA helicase
LSELKLRPYQEEVFTQIRNASIAGFRDICVVSPTGSGKTTIGAFILYSGGLKNNSGLVVAHRRELIYQWSMTLASLGVYHDIIASSSSIIQIKCDQVRRFGKIFYKDKAPIKVASIQTLVVRYLHMDQSWIPKIIVIDEGHHATIGSNYEFLFKHYSKAVRLYFTATPERLDGKGLGASFGGFCDTLIEGMQPKWLIDNGFLSKYRMFCPPMDFSLSDVESKFGEYDAKQIDGLIERSKITGDAIAEYLEHIPNEPAIVFCSSVKHADKTAEKFRNAGVKSESVNGNTHITDRKRILDGLGNGSVHVVTSADLIGEGVDIPNVRGVFGLRPTKSFALWRQMQGRGLRVAEGKIDCMIFDHAGNCERHGLPDSEVSWSLEGSQKRSGSSKDNLKVSVCPKCFSAFKPCKECPSCGHIFENKRRDIKTESGTLVEINLAMLAEMQIKMQKKKEVGRAKTYPDLLLIEKARGYKSGWARIAFNSRRH